MNDYYEGKSLLPRSERRKEEAKARQAVADQPRCEAGALGAPIRGGYDSGIRRSTLRDRIDQTLAEFDYVSARATAALDAKRIIDANPEFADLLDLINRF
jgi:hypothetical protein